MGGDDRFAVAGIQGLCGHGRLRPHRGVLRDRRAAVGWLRPPAAARQLPGAAENQLTARLVEAPPASAGAACVGVGAVRWRPVPALKVVVVVKAGVGGARRRAAWRAGGSRASTWSSSRCRNRNRPALPCACRTSAVNSSYEALAASLANSAPMSGWLIPA